MYSPTGSHLVYLYEGSGTLSASTLGQHYRSKLGALETSGADLLIALLVPALSLVRTRSCGRWRTGTSNGFREQSTASRVECVARWQEVLRLRVAWTLGAMTNLPRSRARSTQPVSNGLVDVFTPVLKGAMGLHQLALLPAACYDFFVRGLYLRVPDVACEHGLCIFRRTELSISREVPPASSGVAV